MDWTRTHQTPLLVAGVGFQLLVLVVMIGILAAPLAFGETVLLRVVPVDPRDLFRGDYVRLGYEISRVPAGGIEGLVETRGYAGHHRGKAAEQTVYVSLEPEADGRHYRAAKASTNRPPSGKYMRGKYKPDWQPGGQMVFGIESFYVPEGTGGAYVEAQRHRRLWAEVALAPWGQATLRGLRIESTRK